MGWVVSGRRNAGAGGVESGGWDRDSGRGWGWMCILAFPGSCDKVGIRSYKVLTSSSYEWYTVATVMCN
jgi:hypothetical protein